MKLLTSTFILMFVTQVCFAQATWSSIEKTSLSPVTTEQRDQMPRKYVSFKLSLFHLKNQLLSAPQENLASRSSEQTTIELPMPDGSMATFVMWSSPVMEPGISARFPQIQSFKGYQIDNPSVVTRILTTSRGFYGSIKTEEGMIYIDPYDQLKMTDEYISYYINDHPSVDDAKKFVCGTDERAMHEMVSKLPKWGTTNRSTGTTTELRKYRTAVACAGEWGKQRGTKEKALEEMNAFINRANLVFETEVALRLVIIDNNDQVIFLDPLTDPYNSPESGGETVGRGTQILNSIIGGASYDVGHHFLPCTDVGGVAAGNICTPNGRGNGVTCYHGIGVNPGTALVFNHEVAHQMSAGHTWNNCPGNEGQLAQGTAYEPGSGSTIMSYAGACGTGNLGVGREAYYHSATLQQILNYTNRDNAEAYICAQKEDVGNTNPEITIITPEGTTIPKSTPFYLRASAVDKENNPMTYSWEQFDALTSAPLGQPYGECPLFRSYKPSVNPLRLFPNKTSIFQQNWTDPKELLPTYGRKMTFRFTVRDNNPMANGVTMQDVVYNVSDNAGPFLMTEPTDQVKWEAGTTHKITWDVANTDAAPVNAKYVDILIGYGNSLDFETNNVVMMAEKTPNDGEYFLKLPDRVSTAGRIIVRGHKNIFFAVSDLVNIQPATKAGHYSTIAELTKNTCLPDPVNFDFTTLGFGGLTDSIKFEIVSGLPTGAVALFEKNGVLPGETNKLNVVLEGAKGTNNYVIVVRTFVAGKDTLEREIYINTTGTDLDFTELKSPAAASLGIGSTQKYEWLPKPDAIKYILEVSKTPGFEAQNILIKHETTGLSYPSELFLDKSQMFFWRVKAINGCRDGEWSRTRTFTTASLLCSTTESGNLNIPISSNGTPTIEAPIVITQAGTINDINVEKINITHTYVKDLVVTLISPKGTQALMWSKECPHQNVNISLDDESSIVTFCPVNNGKVYRPKTPLSTFNGEPMEGRWILKIEDTKVGDNGRVNSYNLEVCANVTVTPPVLTRNNVLNIYPKDKRVIDRILLLTEDTDNTAKELTFTLVETPKKGNLVLNGAPLIVGSTYSQEDVDQFKLEYLHTAEGLDNDYFSFVVTDGKGGYILVNDFVIDVDAGHASNTNDGDEFAQNILVYPNPTQDEVNIMYANNKDNQDWQVTLTDIQGRVIYRSSQDNETVSINLSSYAPGMYLVNIQSNGMRTSRKVVMK